MATTCPFTTYDPLGRQTENRMGRHDVVCVHTMAGYFAYTDEMFHQAGFGGTESHFGIREDGFGKQWQDLEFQADANLDGNHRCISIETADMDHGDVFPRWTHSDVPAWTDAQIDKLVEIIRWCCDRYQIPKVLVPDSRPSRRGIAYHRQGIDPWRVIGGERWSSVRGKVCPGDRRIEQLKTIVIPRVQGDDDMSKETVAEGVELAVKEQGGRARDEYKSLFIGSMVTGLRKGGPDTPPGQGDIRPLMKEIINEVLDEREANPTD